MEEGPGDDAGEEAAALSFGVLDADVLVALDEAAVRDWGPQQDALARRRRSVPGDMAQERPVLYFFGHSRLPDPRLCSEAAPFNCNPAARLSPGLLLAGRPKAAE